MTSTANRHIGPQPTGTEIPTADRRLRPTHTKQVKPVNDTIRFEIATESGYKRKITGELVAVNIAIHRPPFGPSSKRWGLSIVSTGKSIGRFNVRQDAVDFAAQVARMCPEIKDETPELRPDQVAAVIELRKAMRGTKF